MTLAERIDAANEAGWRREHHETRGQHYGLNGPDSSAATECPLCRREPTWTRYARAKDMTRRTT